MFFVGTTLDPRSSWDFCVAAVLTSPESESLPYSRFWNCFSTPTSCFAVLQMLRQVHKWSCSTLRPTCRPWEVAIWEFHGGGAFFASVLTAPQMLSQVHKWPCSTLRTTCRPWEVAIWEFHRVGCILRQCANSSTCRRCGFLHKSDKTSIRITSNQYDTGDTNTDRRQLTLTGDNLH